MMRIQLVSDAMFRRDGEYTVIYLPTAGEFRMEDRSGQIFEQLQILSTGIQKDGLNQTVSPSLLKALSENGLIKNVVENRDNFSNRTEAWISEFSDHASMKLKKVGESRVCVMGCGGLGSLVYQQLLQVGIRNFRLVDSAKVNIADLNRQGIFGVEDIGKPKVEVAFRYGSSFPTSPNIDIVHSRISSTRDASEFIASYQPDIVFSCIDEPPNLSSKWILEAAIQNKVAIVFGEVGIRDGVAGPLLIDRDGMKIFRKYLEKVSRSVVPRIEVVSGSISYTNSTIASLMTRLGFRYLAELPPLRSDTFFKVDFENLSMCETNLDEL